MTVQSYDPRSGAFVAEVNETDPAEFMSALGRADVAAPVLAATSPAERRRWLYAIAEGVERNRDELVALADRETALGTERLQGEIDRTSEGQLRFYGDVAEEGSYLGVSIEDQAQGGPSLVRINQPVGPVAVFGASNFPFAFSVLGSDTASAIAAGCPVVAKAHPAHVGVSELQAAIAAEALAQAGAPAGTFAMISGFQNGIDLVKARVIRAVAFTGSQAGGLALWRMANERAIPIPVFAEMGTVNPVVVTRGAAASMNEVAAGFVGSFTLGGGQFCTKPGLLLAPAGSGAPAAVCAALKAAAPKPVMLTKAISDAVVAGIFEFVGAGADVLAQTSPQVDGFAAPAVVYSAEIGALAQGSRLLEECFGAVAVVCEYRDDEELAVALSALQPSLAASVITSGPGDSQAAAVLDILASRVGRLVVDGWPTGVTCSWAQHHGGPWPSTTVPQATSVGAHALDRFVRPITFQDTPDSWLPPAGRAENPWGLPRRVNGGFLPASRSEL
jgi:NADP-dependent aldehyde dehydrogenase